ncbi:MAG: ester cyclase [Planctomycetota bacterium]|nr:ester cyclase [Planctomycetota bacterium]
MTRKQSDHIRAANEELLVRGNDAAATDYFAEDYVVHLTGQDRVGLELVAGFVRSVRRSFPDLTVEVEILVGFKDRVSWQRTLRGTHKAPFQGFPATGRKMVWRDMLVSRFEDGVIAEEWASSDLAEQLLRARA